MLSALSILGGSQTNGRIARQVAARGGRRILVTSVGDDRATPFLAALLAVGLSQHGHQAVVVEGQRRHRGVARYMRGRGVRSVESTLSEPSETAPDAAYGPTVLPIDEVTEYFAQPPWPEQLGALVDALASNTANVIITGPPVLAGPDVSILAEHVDVVILVVASNRASRAVAGRASSLVRKLGVGLAGAVVTGDSYG